MTENGERRPGKEAGRRAPDRTAASVGHGADTPAPTVRWRAALRDCDLDPVTKAVMRALADRMRPDGTGFVSQQQLAADSGYSPRTVWDRLQRIAETGWIVRTRRGHSLRNGQGVASGYRLTIPVWNSQTDGLELATGANSSLELAPHDLELATFANQESRYREKQLAELDQDELIEAGRRQRPELTGGQVAAQLVVFSEGNVGTKRTEDGWRKGWSGWIRKYDPEKDRAARKPPKQPLPSYTQPPRPSDDELTWGTGYEEAVGGLG